MAKTPIAVYIESELLEALDAFLLQRWLAAGGKRGQRQSRNEWVVNAIRFKLEAEKSDEVQPDGSR